MRVHHLVIMIIIVAMYLSAGLYLIKDGYLIFQYDKLCGTARIIVGSFLIFSSLVGAIR